MTEERDPNSPEELFESFVESGSEDFDSFLVEHSDFTAELRELESAFRNKEIAPAGAAEAHAAKEGSESQGSSGPLIGDHRASEGVTIGDFQLVKKLGRGGMGEVWEAEQLSLSRRVALKILPATGSERAQEFFGREARAGGRLNHPGIVSVMGTGEDEGVRWISMELVEGGRTLRDLLDEMRAKDELPERYYPEIAELFAKIAEAMDVAHEAGVIHRDLKPANIMVTGEGEPKVADFGLARVLDEQGLSQSGEVMGTFYYMSPEQVKAARGGVDHRADVFSLGALFYEALVLARPFEGDTTLQIVEKILNHDPPDPKALRSRVPEDLAVICTKALEKEREARYVSMTELAADLRRHLANEPILAQSPSTWKRTVKWARRNPTKSVASAVAVVAFAAISGLAWQLQEKTDEAVANATRAEANAEEAAVNAERAETNAREAEDNARQAKANEELARANAEEAEENAQRAEESAEEARESAEALATKNVELEAQKEMLERRNYNMLMHGAEAARLAGKPQEARRLHGLCSEPYRGWEWGHLALRLDQSLLNIKSDYASRPLSFSLDGRSFNAGAERSWEVETGKRLPDIEYERRDDIEDGKKTGNWSTGPAFWPFIATISPDRERIIGGLSLNYTNTLDVPIVEGQFYALGVWSVVSGKLLTITAGKGEEYVPFSSAAWSPDGREIASTRGGANVTRIWDAATGELLRTLEGHGRGWTFTAGWSPDGTKVASVSILNELLIWEAKTGEVLQTLELSKPEGTTSRGMDAASDHTFAVWSPDGERIASAKGLALQIWDVNAGESLSVFEVEGAQVNSVAWSPDGTRIVTAWNDPTIRIWDLHDMETPHILMGSETDVDAVAWSPNGDRIISVCNPAHADPTYRVWEVVGIGQQHELEVQSEDRYDPVLDWSPDGARVATGVGLELQVWDASSGERLKTFFQPEEEDPGTILALAWSPDGLRIATGSGASSSVMTTDSGEMVNEFRQVDGETEVYLVDPAVRVWNAETGEITQTLKGHEMAILKTAWSPDGTMIASGDDGGNLWIWDVETWEGRHVVEGAYVLEDLNLSSDCAVMDDLAWSPDSQRIAYVGEAGDDGEQIRANSVRVIDAATGADLQTLVWGQWPNNEGITSLAWHPAGDRIAGGCADGKIGVWDLASGKRRKALEGHTGEVKVMAWSPNGSRLISGSEDGSTLLWDGMTEESLMSLDGHVGPVISLAWNPQGTRIASGGENDTVRIWESRVEDSASMSRAKSQRDQARARQEALQERLDALQKEWLLPDRIQAAIREDSTLSPEQREDLLDLATDQEPTPAIRFNLRAWAVVDPDGEGEGDLSLALAWAEAAVEAAPDKDRNRKTLAWALFANERYEEAEREMEACIELISSSIKKRRQDKELERLRAMIEESQSGGGG